jgi:hypothetical protein
MARCSNKVSSKRIGGKDIWTRYHKHILPHKIWKVSRTDIIACFMHTFANVLGSPFIQDMTRDILTETKSACFILTFLTFEVPTRGNIWENFNIHSNKNAREAFCCFSCLRKNLAGQQYEHLKELLPKYEGKSKSKGTFFFSKRKKKHIYWVNYTETKLILNPSRLQRTGSSVSQVLFFNFVIKKGFFWSHF